MQHSHADHEPVAVLPSNASGPCCRPDAPTALSGAPLRGKSFRIATMDCAAEEAEIRHALDRLPGIRGLRFQLGQRLLTVDADDRDLDTALAAIRNAGFDPKPVAPDGSNPHHAADDGHVHDIARSHLPKLAAALSLAVAAEAISYFAPESMAWRASGLAVAAMAIWLAGFDVYRKGLTALRHGRLNINALMTVAVTGAFVIGQWPEAAMVMALYAIAEAIEAHAVDRARNAIQGLLAMAPERASLRQVDGSWAEVPVAEVAVGATLRVKPGERVPMDGTVRAGQTSINQAPVTGESLPVDKVVGDPVFAGTINESGTFELEVTALASNSTLARIIHAVEEAQATRAPTQGFVDRFAAVYTPTVFVIALAVAMAGPWLLGWTWLLAVYKALVLLVIACPCALVISTPVTIVSGLAAAARRGILIKGGIYLEVARKLKAIALDKTGTITVGKPRLVDWSVVDASTEAATAEHIAAVLARHSDHPVSRAIADGLKPNSVEARNFTALPGRGVQAEVGGVVYALGNHRLIEERGQCSADLEARLKQHEEAGRTVTLLATPERVIALFAVADAIKPSSRKAVASLRELGITPVMLTGDNQATATAVAHEAGIDQARGNLLPEDKLAAIKTLQRELGLTAMTGDGINDAPALAQADIGIAMGAAGTDIAMEAADVVVMNDDLRRIAETVRLSRSTHAVLWQNIALALGIKALFLVLALFGNASMWMADKYTEDLLFQLLRRLRVDIHDLGTDSSQEISLVQALLFSGQPGDSGQLVWDGLFSYVQEQGIAVGTVTQSTWAETANEGLQAAVSRLTASRGVGGVAEGLSRRALLQLSLIATALPNGAHIPRGECVGRLLAALDERQLVIITGGPGAGKSAPVGKAWDVMIELVAKAFPSLPPSAHSWVVQLAEDAVAHDDAWHKPNARVANVFSMAEQYCWQDNDTWYRDLPRLAAAAKPSSLRRRLPCRSRGQQPRTRTSYCVDGGCW